jgi:hypothetical protein
MITGFCIDLEEVALDRTSHKPLHWVRCLSDTLFIACKGPDMLREFFYLLKRVRQHISFCTKTDEEAAFPFCFRTDGSLRCKVSRNLPTLTYVSSPVFVTTHPTSMSYGVFWDITALTTKRRQSFRPYKFVVYSTLAHKATSQTPATGQNLQLNTALICHIQAEWP